jgi:hypothetical protein
MAIERGANAVECDIRHGTNGFYVNHDLIANLGGRTPLSTWLDAAAIAARNHGNKFALIYFDLKDAASQEHVANLVNIVQKHAVSKEAKLKFIYSVGKLRHTNAFADCYLRMNSNEGFNVDDDNSPKDVTDFYKKLDVERCWYGNGVNAMVGLPWAPNIIPSLKEANGYRGKGNGKVQKTMSWTYNDEEPLMRFLDRYGELRVDAIIVNCGGGHGTPNAMPKILAGYHKLRGLRYATRLDDPFEYQSVWY